MGALSRRRTFTGAVCAALALCLASPTAPSALARVAGGAGAWRAVTLNRGAVGGGAVALSAVPPGVTPPLPPPLEVSCAAPALTFTGTSLTLSVGDASALPPPLTATCHGAPAPNPIVTFTLTQAGSTDAVLMAGTLGAASAILVGDEHGVVIPPLLTSGLAGGEIALQATWSGASATLPVELSGELSGILPPQNPAHSLELTGPVDCRSANENSEACVDSSLALLNEGRRSEALAPLLLPANWPALSVPEQLFTLTDLERTARGLPAISGLAADWDGYAHAGANNDSDPSGFPPAIVALDPSSPSYGIGTAGASSRSIWAPALTSIQAMAMWMYADGIFPDGESGDRDCTTATPGRCWGHRDSVLEDEPAYSCQLVCAMGAAFATTSTPTGSYTEAFGGGDNTDPLVFSWASELAQLPECERAGDSCSWSAVPAVPSPRAQPRRAPAPLRILRHSVSADTATLVLSVSRAGRLVAGGGKLSRRSVALGRASRVTLTLRLNAKTYAKIPRRSELKVKVEVIFTPLAGARTQRALTLSFWHANVR